MLNEYKLSLPRLSQSIRLSMTKKQLNWPGGIFFLLRLAIGFPFFRIIIITISIVKLKSFK